MDGLAESAPGRGTASPELEMERRHRRCAELARQAHARALQHEPALTRGMRQAVAAVELGGTACHLEGLSDCVKPLASLVRKARDDCLELGLDPDTAVVRIRDAIRYTVVVPGDGFAAGVERFRASLAGQGMRVVRSMNMFLPGNRYMGVHDEVEAGGQRFEIQFHTEESLAAKAWSRSRFEVIRDPAARPADRAAAYDECVRHSAESVPIPDGVERLGEPKRTARPAPLL